MSGNARSFLPAIDRLENMYRPKARICRGMITMAPWVDIALLAVFFVLVSHRFVLRPGITLELPNLAAMDGTPYGHTAVILSLEGRRPPFRREVVIFDDERFFVDQTNQMATLERRLAGAVQRRRGLPLILEADRRVQHGTLTRVYRMARKAGILTVNLATDAAAAAGEER